MTRPPEEPCGSCREFRDLVFHFQAEELSAAERARFEGHLHTCPPCERYLEVEAGFATVLRAGLPRTQAPDALRERVCRSIEQEGKASRPVAPGLRFLTVALLAAAAAFMATLVAPPLFRGVQGQAQLDAARHVVRAATVVDEDCDRAGHTTDQQRNCHARSHFNALRMADGTYWTLSLDAPEARQLVADVEMRGHRIVVEGDLYAPIRTLHLTRWREMHGGTL